MHPSSVELAERYLTALSHRLSWPSLRSIGDVPFGQIMRKSQSFYRKIIVTFKIKTLSEFYAMIFELFYMFYLRKCARRVFLG